MANKVTAPYIRQMKESKERIVCVTAYDAVFASLVDEAGVDLILVGDSVGNTVMGYRNMLNVGIEEIVHHTSAVARGAKRALLVADLPFGSYQVSAEEAVRSAVQLVRAGAEAVKLEGDYVEAIEAITRAGIPVIGHLGMTPQSVHSFGGFKVQGKGDEAQEILETAQAVEEAGAFALVLELVPSALAAKITQTISIPTIGIGAGPNCDGEIQVIYDILGFSQKQYRHSKSFLQGRTLLRDAVSEYASQVRDRQFPTEENVS